MVEPSPKIYVSEDKVTNNYKVKKLKLDDLGSGIHKQSGFHLHAAWKVLENPLRLAL